MLAKRKMNCKDAKRIDIIDLLASLGYKPKKINEKEAWYISPFRPNENEPSFRVNRNKLLWYDYGAGCGGDIIKLGCLLFNCSISELLEILEKGNFSFSQPEIQPYVNTKSGFRIKVINEITSPTINKYIKERGIHLETASIYCKQIDYAVRTFRYVALGFKNDSDGWELRGVNFKGATVKDISTIRNGSNIACVFEGFFDLLSFMELYKNSYKKYDLISLNSVALSKRLSTKAAEYSRIFLFLDNDPTGKKYKRKLISETPQIFTDKSHIYKGFKDLNDFLVS